MPSITDSTRWQAAAVPAIRALRQLLRTSGIRDVLIGSNESIHAFYATPQHPGTATPVFVLRNIPTTLSDTSSHTSILPSPVLPLVDDARVPTSPLRPLLYLSMTLTALLSVHWPVRHQQASDAAFEYSWSPSGHRAVASSSIPTVSTANRRQHSEAVARWHRIDASLVEGEYLPHRMFASTYHVLAEVAAQTARTCDRNSLGPCHEDASASMHALDSCVGHGLR